MIGHLDRLVACNQCGNGNHAAVSWRQPRDLHSATSGPCAYFSSAGATILLSITVCIGFLPFFVSSP